MELSARHVGTIRLAALLGEGGMGAVYEGWDERLERPVAVKKLRGDRLDPKARQRLIREAKILGRLKHTNICTIYELLEAEGAIHLVLERIEGSSLPEWLKSGPGRRSRLEVATQIATAVAAAHTQGVLHRDLKPCNVMVTPEGVAKVLDFGLAASEVEALATGEAAPEGSAASVAAGRLTLLGGVVGTASNMSPEQARGEPLTLASDIFSLGLLLQELLSGQAPYPEDLRLNVLILRAQRAESEPVRGLDRRLTALIEEMKRPDPLHRPTAGEVVASLRSIAALPARRARAAAVLAMVAASLIGVARYSIDLRAERDRALAAEQVAREARLASEEQMRFLTGLFSWTDPSAARGRTLTVRELLDPALATLRSEAPRAVTVRVKLLDMIGTLYAKIGQLQQAEPVLREGLALARAGIGETSVEAADLRQHLGTLLFARADLRAAEEMLGEALAARERLSGPQSLAVAETSNSLGGLLASQDRLDEAERRFERARAIRERELGPRHVDVAASLANLAGVAFRRGDLAAAEPKLRRAVAITATALPAGHPAHAANLQALALVLQEKGELADSEVLNRQALAIWEQSFGADHPRVALACSNLGDLLVRTGQLDEAERLYRRALDIRTRALGVEHPDQAFSWLGLAELYRLQGRARAAKQALEEALRLRRNAYGPESPAVREVEERLGRAR